MPEQDNEQVGYLRGERAIPSSSDEAIAAAILDIRQQIHGLPDPNVVLEGASLAPLSVTSSSLADVATPGDEIISVVPGTLTPNHSLMALRIFRDRENKKAA